LVEQNDMLGKAAGRGAKIEPAALDLRLGAKDLLCSQGIEHRLQGRGAGHQLARLSFSPAALVVSYPSHTRGMGFNEINRPAELNAAIEVDCVRYRLWISLTPVVSPSKPEAQLEMRRHIARLILARQPQPFAKIGTDRHDPIFPHAVDRGRKVVVVTGADLANHAVEYFPDPV
jgi:hypothetical protein